MAHKKGVGSSKNGRESHSKRLGVKIFGGQVAKAGNISKAANQLYISQPAISKSISKLEAELGTALFSRSSKGVTLTEEGQVLYEYVERAFDSLNMGEENLKNYKELGIGHIRIGVSTSLCKHILLDYLKDFIRVVDTTPADIGDIQQTIEATEVHERTEIGDVLDGTFQYLAFFQFAHDLGTLCFDIAFDECFV